ncbi:histidine kinase [Emticicia agri]|uniref:Signal transduction histidine kinase internal region domain-containing protein n=1 Tax=Emticicia agri TaxID=2492393 RepID=A0A4Q5M4M4_9BACT|nr:histidine kinase [Emticicia agri]RYU97328.1 hypothetical protein EWM59_01155 [Emticicia agri]
MRCLIGMYFLLWIGLQAKAQQVETIFIPASNTFIHEPYLRFDSFVIENEVIKKAYSKEMRLQDHQGYLWFVADNQSLIRYDGHYAKTYDSTRFYGIQMINKTVWSLTDSGVAIFDTTTETFASYPTPLVKNYVYWGAASDSVSKLYILFPSNSDNVRSPFFEFDIQKKKFRHIQLSHLLNGYTQKYEPDSLLILCKPLTVDTKGRVWGQISYGSDTDHGRSAFGYYDPHSNIAVWYPLYGAYNPEIKNKNPNAPQEMSISNVYIDNRYIWVGGWYYLGLLRFDIQTLRWKQYHFSELVANQVFYIRTFQQNKFILYSNNGIKVFDKFRETLHEYPHIPDNQFSPPTNSNSIFSGDRNTIWIGKHNAIGDAEVFYLSPENQVFRTFPQAMKKERLRVFCQYKTQLFFTYQNPRGFVLAAYDEQSGKVSELFRQPYGETPEQYFHMAMPDTINQVIWFVGKVEGGSIRQWDLRRKQMINVQAPIQDSKLRTDQLYNVMSLTQDKEGNIWIPVTQTTLTTEGSLIKYDSRIKQYRHIKSIENLINKQRLRSVMADSRGTIWLGSWDDNLIRWFNPKTEQLSIKNAINRKATESNIPINKMIEDTRRGVIWIAATKHGLWKYTMNTNQWQQIPLSNVDFVFNLQLAHDGILWIKSDNGLVRYSPDTGTFKQFGAEYDLKIYDYGMLIKGNNDELFFDRFRFYPQEIRDNASKPKPIFSFIKVFDQELALSQNINTIPEITLRYNQNFFTVGFSVLSYIQHQKNQYMYRLDNFNKNWITCGNNPSATFTNVPPGEYTLYIKGANSEGIWSDIRSLKITITPPYWQTWWFRGLIAVFIFGILYLLYRYRIAQQTLKSRLAAEEALNKQREAEYQQRIAQTEIAALRAQMNPHFIFNCLNSIQYYVANNDLDAASDYLTKFSRLIRLVLENSRSEKVTLSNELETLRFYIEMEAMRFGKKLNYEIRIDEDIEPDILQIPPLLIQPFVENAVWHGLMHKPQGGTVSIAIKQPQAETLQILITDDGIGRKKAVEFKSKSATNRKSFGLKVTTERIELINGLYQTNTKVQMIDLTDAQGQASGTQVIVEIPI